MTDRATRVLQVVTDSDRRGAQVFAVEVARPLADLGLDVRTVALAAGPVGGLDVELLGPRRLHPRTLRALRTAMAEADVVVAHGSTTLPACLGASVGRRRPILYRQIGDPAYWTPTWAKRLRVRLYYRGAAHVVALSAATRAALDERFGVPAAKVTVIPNAVDESRYPRADDAGRGEARRRLGLSDVDRVVGYVGALVEEKGVADLVDAVPAGAVLLVAGDGDERAELDRRARDRGLDARFLGRRDDLWDVYAATDLIALPSRSEGQPAVLIEAGLVGRAVVSSRVGAVADIVEHGRTGVLVDPGDGPALGRELRRLLEDGAAARALGAAAAERTREHFTLEVVARQWAQVLVALAAPTDQPTRPPG